VSFTTRSKSSSEVDGKDYWFVSEEEFREQINKGQLLEYAEVFGNLYGTSKDKINEAIEAGKTVILEIDVQGGKQAKRVYPDAEMIFILPPTHKELASRMNLRGRECAETAKKRLTEADDETAAAWQHYEHMVINDDLEQAIKEVVHIVQSNSQ
jgi:guanylate kinase